MFIRTCMLIIIYIHSYIYIACICFVLSRSYTNNFVLNQLMSSHIRYKPFRNRKYLIIYMMFLENGCLGKLNNRKNIQIQVYISSVDQLIYFECLMNFKFDVKVKYSSLRTMHQSQEWRTYDLPYFFLNRTNIKTRAYTWVQFSYIWEYPPNFTELRMRRIRRGRKRMQHLKHDRPSYI